MTASASAPGSAPTLPGLGLLMDAAWPAPEREESAGWVLRAASGVTQRANSVWPREPEGDTHQQRQALRAARLWYRGRRLPLIFQVFDDPRFTRLNTILDGEGFTRQSETLVMCRSNAAQAADQPPADLPAVLQTAAAQPGVEISTDPSDEWLELWWSVDGRGGTAERETARSILAGCPSLYALVRSDDGVPAAVGRLALPPDDVAHSGAGGWGGLYCMAIRPDARRRGHALRIMQALLHEGTARNLAGYWLLVTAGNSGARQFYARAGFRETCRYNYRQERPKRHLTGC